MKFETDKIGDKIFGIEAVEGRNEFYIKYAYERENGRAEIYKIELNMDIRIELPINTKSPIKAMSNILGQNSKEWYYIKNQVEKNRKLPPKKQTEAGLREKMLSKIEQDEEEKKAIKIVKWAINRLKNDASYQKYASETGDVGLKEAQRLYGIDHFDKCGFSSKEEAMMFFNLLKKSRLTTVGRNCRLIAQKDGEQNLGIFPDIVHKKRKNLSEKSKDTRVEISKAVDSYINNLSYKQGHFKIED